MGWNTNGEDRLDYTDQHFVHQVFLRPGGAHDSPIWDTYIKPLVDPFADDPSEFRYCNERGVPRTRPGCMGRCRRRQ